MSHDTYEGREEADINDRFNFVLYYGHTMSLLDVKFLEECRFSSFEEGGVPLL